MAQFDTLQFWISAAGFVLVHREMTKGEPSRFGSSPAEVWAWAESNPTLFQGEIEAFSDEDVVLMLQSVSTPESPRTTTKTAIAKARSGFRAASLDEVTSGIAEAAAFYAEHDARVLEPVA